MNRYIVGGVIVFVLLIVSLSIFNGDLLEIVDRTTEIEVVDSEIDLGDIFYNIPKLVTFRVNNIGENPLLIEHLEPSCGCVKTEWKREPIGPGNYANIRVKYDAREIGFFYKTVIVYCNIQKRRVRLSIKGKVVKQ
ncbi:DUF1573 domain-containing protein [Halosquirtibacter xylanolyticus]|uniref:DUF1573 domain-containing protein n=1 Tax=Halosquirtibacter xylanolyticus TaxID=3374599 RepID=UPI003748BA29|nr:DUF1573 domain-containing protein [Prolixibacteraceae bacterium]